MVNTRSSPAKAAGKASTRKQATAADVAAACPEVCIMVTYTGQSAAADTTDAAAPAPMAEGADAPDAASGAELATEAVSFQLPHPRTGAPAAFMRAGGRLLEVNIQRPAQSSWFAGDSVISDGGLYMATPVDPTFVLLPLLEAAASQGMFRELGEILDSAEQRGLRHLGGRLAEGAAAAVCDVKVSGGDSFVRLNEDKVLAWLRCKVDASAAALAATSSGAYAGVDKRSLQHYGVGLLTEWLPPARLAALQKALGIAVDGQPLTAPQALPHRTGADDRPQKRLRLDPKEIAKARAKVAKAEAKAAQVAKETRGMKKMSAFFKKPAAKAAA